LRGRQDQITKFSKFLNFSKGNFRQEEHEGHEEGRGKILTGKHEIQEEGRGILDRINRIGRQGKF
jgi:hypothetical protein